MSLRDDQVAAALKFLGNEKVVSRPRSEKEDFLTKKGLTAEEIAEALRQYEAQVSASPASPGAAGVASSTASPAAAPFPVPASVPPARTYPAAPATVSYPQAPAGQPPAPYYGSPGPMYAHPLPMPQESTSSPWLALMAGGVAVGGGLALISSILRGSPGSSTDGAPAQVQQAPTGASVAREDGAASSVRPDNPLLSSGSPVIKLSGEDKTKAACHDVLEMIRSYSEETRGMSATFQRCLQQNQDQHQNVLAEISDFLQASTQNQKTQKEKPIVLSAASIQSLASLMNGASGGVLSNNGASIHVSNASDHQEENGAGAGAGAVSGPSAAAAGSASAVLVNSIKGTFDAINRNLHQLVHESSSKADAQKSLSTLVLILSNVLNNPSSEKHRKVNTSSQRFKVLKQGAGAELLKLAGFEYQEPNFNLPVEQDTSSAQNAKDLIQALQRDIDQVWAARPTDVSGHSAGTEVAPPLGAIAPPDAGAAVESHANTVAVAHPAEAVPVAHQPSSSLVGLAVQPALLEAVVVAHPAESQDLVPPVSEAAPMRPAAPAHPAEALDQQALLSVGAAHPADIGAAVEEPQPHCGG